MKLHEILSEWEKDSKIDKTALDSASLKTPSLHHKYLKIYIAEKIKFKEMDFAVKELELKKWEYYSGKMSEEELEAEGWEPWDKKVLKPDMDRYLKSDKDVIDKLIALDIQKEKVEAVQSILSTINNRSFHISNAIKWSQFLNGELS